MSLPLHINPNAIVQCKALQRQPLSVTEMVTAIRGQNRTVLSQAITLLESTQVDHVQKAEQLIAQCIQFYTDKTIRIGITGAPGVGKSTFIEVFTKQLVAQGKQVAILAIDPSSTVSGGSILGDKTRMGSLVSSPQVFIRPSPSGALLGGVARQTREAIVLCETAGFDVVLIETVGVGQSETTVRSMVDFFLLLQLAGAGDALQGIKRGIMEMADAVVVTKADGSTTEIAMNAAQMLAQVMHVYPAPPSGHLPSVLTCSAKDNTGIDTIWDAIQKYLTVTRSNGFFETQRTEQQQFWLYQTIEEQLKQQFYSDPAIQKALPKQLKAIQQAKSTPFAAAQYLLGLKKG